MKRDISHHYILESGRYRLNIGERDICAGPYSPSTSPSLHKQQGMTFWSNDPPDAIFTAIDDNRRGHQGLLHAARINLPPSPPQRRVRVFLVHRTFTPIHPGISTQLLQQASTNAPLVSTSAAALEAPPTLHAQQGRQVDDLCSQIRV